MQENLKPLISIVTVCFNSAKTIRKTIESVLNQTYTNIEYILVDGKSTDNTVAIIEEYAPQFAAKGIIYRWISEPDTGIYDAMNKGIKLATGEWVGIINSDDWYELDACSNITLIYEENLNIKIINGCVKFWQNNQVMYIKQNSFNCLQTESIMHPGVFIKKDVYFEKVGLYNQSFKIAADYDFFIRCHLKKIPYIMCDNIISNFSLSGISSTSKIVLSKETLNIQVKYNFLSRLCGTYKLIKIVIRYKLLTVTK